MSSCVVENDAAVELLEPAAVVDEETIGRARRDSPPPRTRARVLVLIKGLGLGGAEKLLSMSAPYLDRDRFDYEVGYFLPWKTALVDELRYHDLPVTCLDMSRPFSPAVFPRLLRFIQQGRFDVVHMHLPVPGVLGRIAGKLAGVAGLIYTEHGLWQRLHPLARLANRWTLSLNDRVLAVSEDVCTSFPNSARPNVQTIPNGIACRDIRPDATIGAAVRREFGIPADHFVVGKVANLTPVKNHEMLLRVFADLRRQFHHSTLVLVGQFAGRENALRRLCRELNIVDHVLFTGPRTDVLRVVQAFDVFALSSRLEGLPVSLLEAMALAKPAVCTAVGGIPGLVRDGREGFLVPADRDDVFSDRLAALAEDPRLRESLGEAARLRVLDEFDVATMVRRVEQVYVDVLKEKQRWTSR